MCGKYFMNEKVGIIAKRKKGLLNRAMAEKHDKGFEGRPVKQRENA